MDRQTVEPCLYPSTIQASGTGVRACDEDPGIFVQTSLSKALYQFCKMKLVRCRNQDRMVVATFSDGTDLMLEVAWRSECDGPASDDGPDLSWNPPTVWTRWVSASEQGR
jgi:hypothetical protein